MKFKKRDLQNFIYDTINPLRLFQTELTSADFENWDRFLGHIQCQFTLKLSEELYGLGSAAYKHEYLKSFQKYLLMLSNTVHHYLTKDFKVWSTSPSAVDIKSHFQRTLSFLDELLYKAEKQYPEYFDINVPLTNFRLQRVIPVIRNRSTILTRRFRDLGLDQQLVDLFSEGVNNVVRMNNFSTLREQYLNRLLDILNEDNIEDDQSLLFGLISGNFNRTGVFGYIIDRCEAMMNEMEGLYEQLELVLEQRMDFIKIQEESTDGLLQDMPSLKLELLDYCHAKSVYLKELMELRRMAEQDQKSTDQIFKILLEITVPQFSLLIRLLMDNGILAKRQVNKLYAFFARNFYTDRTAFISPGSLQSKASNIQFHDALRLYEIFLAATRWLEEQFGLKNYKRALH